MLLQSLNEKFGLDKRTELEYIGENHVAIIKFVKRRLLVADGEKFVEVAQKIHAIEPDLKVSLLCSENICSKTVALLNKAGIDVLMGTEEEE